MRRAKLRRFFRIAAAYLLVAILAALGWLWHSLPSEILLEPGQSLSLPRFSLIEPLRSTGSRNAASTQAVGSYQVTLSLGGWLPIKPCAPLWRPGLLSQSAAHLSESKCSRRAHSSWAFPI